VRFGDGGGERELVAAALARLREEGCTLALAPMDGSTWRSYRFVTGGTAEPPFFLEPANAPGDPDWFREAGFEPLARYSSSVFGLEPEGRPDLARVEARLAERGVRVRGLDVGAFEAELDRLFALSLAAFADNYLYTPIGREEFGALYQGVRELARPEFVRFAEVDGEPVAFVFAYPDVLEARRGEPVRTLVVKTLACHPRWRHLGIGSVLVALVQDAARERGFTRAIHALQHETNVSLKITRRNQGERFREYTLFARSLRGPA
jgi:GNAT superfamily N-acetyltransferase